ncbi:hypothetical protein, partial [Yersinia pestis]|uniref:hypothetical protein n=1 Tax=Yersinia pestis TaxID=632 RepID=UPI00050BEBE6
SSNGGAVLLQTGIHGFLDLSYSLITSIQITNRQIKSNNEDQMGPIAAVSSGKAEKTENRGRLIYYSE